MAREGAGYHGRPPGETPCGAGQSVAGVAAGLWLGEARARSGAWSGRPV